MLARKVREAKNFLAQQTIEQAFLGHVPFSDLEKRMMHFTETGEMSEDPIELNTAFEAGYDSEEYEAKVSKLMRHAHARLKKENSRAAKIWSEAVRELQKGDHYILLFTDTKSPALASLPVKTAWWIPLCLVVLLALLILPIGFNSGPRRAGQPIPGT